MNAPSPYVKGWCPGALRPMPTGDGLLARVRPSAGRLSLDQLDAIVEIARACGNGAIELTSRANVQLRGVVETSLADLHLRLARARLLDADPAIERARNIVASPLGDIDPDCALDAAPLVAALEAELARDAATARLPAKFSFVVDVGGRLPLGEVDADARFLAARSANGPTIHVVLGGRSSAAFSPVELPHVASRLTRAFLDLAGSGAESPRRMRALVRRFGAEAIFAAAGLRPDGAASRAGASPRDAIGALAFGDSCVLGAAPPFGRADASSFAALSRAARAQAASGCRVTPWRALLITGLDANRARRLAKEAEALGFISSADDPRLAAVACPGAPACAHAAHETPRDADAFARALGAVRGGTLLHVSGCAKGCAHTAPARWTLVANSEGYDLVENGRPGETPSQNKLSSAQVAAYLTTFNQGAVA